LYKWYERTISLSAQINIPHCKIHKQQDKGGYGGVILKWGSTKVSKHRHWENKTLLLRTKQLFIRLMAIKNKK